MPYDFKTGTWHTLEMLIKVFSTCSVPICYIIIQHYYTRMQADALPVVVGNSGNRGLLHG